MDLLVTIDENYLQPLAVMLTSLHLAAPEDHWHVWLLHRSLTDAQVADLTTRTTAWGWQLSAIQVEAEHFEEPKTTKRYPQEMYYRLLCGELLPESVKKVIYLDPDILVLHSLKPLWRKRLAGHLFAAATHSGFTDMINDLNRVRLNQDHGYYNSGVLVIDVAKARRQIKLTDINQALRQYERQLLLPDQDLLNLLYGDWVVPLDEQRYNYDARKFLGYYTRSRGKHDMPWVMAHTAILHFCGSAKPWQPGHDTRFTALYLNYLNRL